MDPTLHSLLVIEDSPEYGLLVVEMLKATFGRDIKVERTHLAGDGADRLRQGYVDCVLLDLGLPDADGLEALELLQETAPDVPVVILSQNRDEPLTIEAMREGAQDYLWKGATTSHELRRAILYAVQRHQRQNANAD
ncbi:MAG TPA: response regulator [Thermoleophilaceae bacterium]|nr:response regulator [Thermoleophilaceae bacterium]